MADETRADRMNRICDEIGYALGRGELPSDKLREFEWLWITTPDSEKSGVRMTLKDLSEFVRRQKQEFSERNRNGPLSAPIHYRRPGMCEGNYAGGDQWG